MKKNLEMQLQCKFALELLTNSELRVVNYLHSDDTDYVGSDIVESLSAYYDRPYLYVVNNIAFEAATTLLRQKAIDNFYVICYKENGYDGAEEDSSNWYYCTDIKAAASAVSKLYSECYLDDDLQDEFDKKESIRTNLCITLFSLENNKIKHKRIH